MSVWSALPGVEANTTVMFMEFLDCHMDMEGIEGMDLVQRN